MDDEPIQPRYGPGEGIGFKLAVCLGAYALSIGLYFMTGQATTAAVLGWVIGSIAGVGTGIWSIRRYERDGPVVSTGSPVTWGLVAGAAGLVYAVSNAGESAMAFLLVGGMAWFGGLFLTLLVWDLMYRAKNKHPEET